MTISVQILHKIPYFFAHPQIRFLTICQRTSSHGQATTIMTLILLLRPVPLPVCVASHGQDVFTILKCCVHCYRIAWQHEEGTDGSEETEGQMTVRSGEEEKRGHIAYGSTLPVYSTQTSIKMQRRAYQLVRLNENTKRCAEL